MYNISICSINVNGLRNPVKRRQIFDSCNSQGVDILLLQETHAAGYMEARAWGKEFGGRGFWSFGTNVSCGVAILFSKNKKWDLTDNLRDNKGRLISITVNTQNSTDKIRIINCYAPNDPGYRQCFFREQLQRHNRGLRRVILGGDFNCVPNFDSIGHSLNGTKGYNEIKLFCSFVLLTILLTAGGRNTPVSIVTHGMIAHTQKGLE